MNRILKIAVIVSSLLVGFSFADSENVNITDNTEKDVEIAKSTKEIEEEEEGGYGKVTTKKYHNYFGICSGVTLKYGISYRRWFMDDNFGLQLHVFPLLIREKDYDDSLQTTSQLKVGLTFLKTIKSYQYARVLYYLNGTFNYNVYDEYHWDYETYEDEYIEVEEKLIAGATGPGFEFYVWRFAIDLFVGVSAGYNVDTEEMYVLPALETALHFRF